MMAVFKACMPMKEIVEKIEDNIPGVEVSAEMKGAHLSLKVTSDFFRGQSRLQRQRFVKGLLAPWIESGQVHALCLKVDDSGEKHE